MWQVLRRHQGDVYDAPENIIVPTQFNDHPKTSAATKLEITLRSIALHEAKPSPKPQDPMKLTTPYGNVIYDKIKRHLSHESVVLRRQAVKNLLDLFMLKGEHVVTSVRHGLIAPLTQRLDDPDDDIRAQACIALEVMVRTPSGQAVILDNGTATLARLLKATDDGCSDVVVEALRLLTACHSVHNEYEATKRLIRIGCIPQYVAKARDREDSIACAACSCLLKIFDIKEGFIGFLESHGVEAVTKVLSRKDEPLILVEASEVIGAVAFYGAGKVACVQQRTLSSLVPLLSNENIAVRQSVSGAVAQLTVLEGGKAQALECSAVPALLAAIAAEEELDVLINIIKAITSLAEHPSARQQLAAALPRIQEIMGLSGDVEPLRKCAEKAIAVISWHPGSTHS
jgi:hypothetical protein